jgi:glutamate/tyrosine decarboxylase-like PLP-dependent enzyme
MTKFPKSRKNWKSLKNSMISDRSNNLVWNSERVFKPAYFAGDDVLEVAHQAYNMFIDENALYGKTSYPSLYRYETEIVEMLVDLLNGSANAGGSLTSGGTESNIIAMNTAREWANDHRPEIVCAEIVVPRTAHPSFEKGAKFLKMKVVRLGKGPDLNVDLDGMEKAINSNTVMLVGSAPPYPYGHTDPIAKIGEIAQKHGLWMHVDGCLGGLILPFAREFDSSIPNFDFSVPSVDSISLDIHKYGYSAKGISALMFQNKCHTDYNRTSFDDWPGGLYSTPNLAGSRSGGAIASGWAVINYLGYDGYREIVSNLINLRQEFINGINSIDGLSMVGNPQTFQFAFCSDSYDIFAVADGLADLGWHIGRALEPKSIQLMITMAHKPIAQEFLSDLSEISNQVEKGTIVSRNIGPVYANG